MRDICMYEEWRFIGITHFALRLISHHTYPSTRPPNLRYVFTMSNHSNLAFNLADASVVNFNALGASSFGM